MKKLLLLGLIALIGIGAAAFTSSEPKEEKANLQVLYWFDESTGQFTGRINTTEDEENETPCVLGVNSICERGYEEADLVDPDDPYQGLVQNAVHDDVIMKQ